VKPIVLVSIVLVLLLAGCNDLTLPANTGAPPASDTELLSTPTAKAVLAKSPEQTQLEGKVWRLQSINGESALPDVEVTLEFSAGVHRIEGYTGCNRYEGPYERSGYELDIAEIAITEQNCPQKNIMEQERLYEDILWDVTAYAIEDDTLTLKTDSGETLVLMSRQ